MRTYTPTMSEQEIAKRRKWMRQMREEITRSEKEKKVRLSHSSIHLMVPWGVHPPLWDDSLLLAEVVEKEIQPNMSVLDIGTGSGIQGIVAALRGAFVLSTDICPRAVQAARWNAERYQMEKNIEARESDCFNHISEKFNRIVFNPPHFWFEPENILDHIITDNQYILFWRFLKNAREHLEEEGKIFLMCSTMGDVEYMQKCIEENEYEIKVCASRISPSRWHYAVYELK